MKEQKISINDSPQVPEYKSELPKEGDKAISMSNELNTLDEPISTTIVFFFFFRVIIISNSCEI